MAEYIEREALNCMLSELEELARKRVYDTPTSSPAYMRYVTQSQERAYLKNKISELPAEDVAPVVYGEWIAIEKWASKAQYKCSVCGRRIMASLDVAKVMGKYPYCNCGAKMQEVR